jgi:hypothetical protein
MLDTPILFIIFNRPDVTEEVFNVIKKHQPKQLFIAADGPRSGSLEDLELCKETRSVINKIDWPCELKTLFRDQNLGCGLAVSSSISWFFEHVEEGIILEDDCLPNDSFFTFCEILLEKYRNTDNVMHIGGSNFQFGTKYSNSSYYFSAIPHVWGWASWRRAWKLYDYNLSDLNIFLNKNKISNYISDKKTYNFWFEIFCKMNQKKIDTWDYQWQYAIWNNNGLSIIPSENLIKNIGFGINATHTKEQHEFSKMPTQEIHQIVFNNDIKINREADEAFFKRNQ